MTTYEPRGGARELLLSRAPTVLLSGPAGTGKSVAALQKIHLTSLMVPNVVTLLLRQTQASLSASSMRTYEIAVAAQELGAGVVTWFGGSASKPPAYRYPNGSMIIPGGLDRPSKFLSMDVSRIIIEEASEVTQTAVEVVATRLRGGAATYRQMVCVTNPDHPAHHLHQMVLEGRAQHILSRHTENPFLYNSDGSMTVVGSDYMSRLKALTGTRRARYYEGRWVASEGQIWDTWDVGVHVIDSFDVPNGWRCIESVDWGFQHAMTWGRFAVDPDGRMYLVAEMSRRHRLVEDFAKDILEVRESRGWGRPEVLVTDHAAGDRATLERHLREPTVPARKAVTVGIQAVANRLAVQPDGKPRLSVFRDSLVRNDPLAATDRIPRGFVAEVNGYVWAPARVEGGVPKEEPKKEQDDSCDMVRYAVMHLDGAPPGKLGNPAAPRSTDTPAATSSAWSRPVGR